MGSMSFPLSTTTSIRWPSACAVCGAPSEGEAVTTVSTSKNVQYYGVLLKWTKHSLQLAFPVCAKHRTLCWLLDFPSRWGFVDAFLYLLFVPGLLWLALSLCVAVLFGVKGDALDPISTTLAALLWGSAIAYYAAAMFVKPVRLSDLHKGKLTISIKNEHYFSQFQSLNASMQK